MSSPTFPASDRVAGTLLGREAKPRSAAAGGAISAPHQRILLVDLAGQYAGLREELLVALEQVLGSGRFIHADVIGEFEQAFAAYCGARHAVAVNSGTAALHLGLLASGISPGDEVITVPNSFVATAAAICHAGARPVFVDVDPETATMGPARVEAALTVRTRALLPVHLYGHPAAMDELRELAARHGLLVIEDACQAHGAEYRGRRAGVLGDAACFSFYPGKNLGGYGEGGMVVTDRAEIAEQVRLLRDHGAREKYRHDLIGFNERLDALQAAILAVKLPHLPEWTRARRDRAALYDELLAGADLRPMAEQPWARSAYHLYVIRTPWRDHLRTRLAEAGIETGIHYPVPIHLQPAFAELGYRPGTFPVAEQLAGEVLSLPLYPELPLEAQHRVATAVRAELDRLADKAEAENRQHPRVGAGRLAIAGGRR